MSGTVRPLPDTAVCRQCGYALRDLPRPICPECGRPFDPADPATYRLANESYLRRHYGRPPQRSLHYAVGIVTGLALLDISSPGDDWFPGAQPLLWLAIVLLFILTTVDHALRLAFVVHDGVHNPRRAELYPRRPRLRPWIIAPLCFALLVSSLWYPWPVWMRFALSRPAFERVARRGGTVSKNQRVGGFMVRSATPLDDGAVFFETGDGFLDNAGIVFFPSGQPTLHPDLRTRYRLADSWYTGNLGW